MVSPVAMKSLVVTLGLLLGASHLAQAANSAAPNGTRSSFTFERHGSEFRVELTQTYPADFTWEQVLLAHGDAARIEEVSDYFVRTQVVDPGVQPFRLAMTAREYGFEKTTVALCKETSNATTWQRRCELLVNEADGGNWFRWGRPSTTCVHNEGSPIVCKIAFEGSPKGFDYVIVRRSDAQFGVYLSAVAMEDGVRLGWLATGASGNEARNNYVRDPFRKTVHKFREVAAEALRKNPDGDLRIEGGNTADTVVER